MITQTINLNLIPGGVLPRIKVSQYDKGSRVLQFNLFNGSSAFTIPVDASITIQGTKADHTGFQYSCTFSGSVVTADLEQQMTVFPGDVECEIRISQDDGDVLLGTCNFILDVEEAALQDDIIISETELPLVEKAAEAADAAEASALDAEAWAVGQRDGEDVPADDPAYHNNAKYYAETVPTLLTNYYTKSETYSKGEVDTALGGKQDTLTFDDSPTSASSNPVKSGGVYSALAGKVDTEAGKGLSANDFTNTEKAKVDNAVLWEQAKEYVGKNKGKIEDGSQTDRGVTFTSNNGVVTFNGTATAYSVSAQYNNFATLPAGSYIFTGCPSDGGLGKYQIGIFKNGEGTAFGWDTGDGYEFTLTETTTIYIKTYAYQGYGEFTNFNMYLMVRLASIADETYEPYLPSNEELANATTPIDITSSFFGTMPTNVTLHQGKIYQIGKQIIGNIVIKKSDNITNTKFNIPVTAQYLPKTAIISGCFIGDEWSTNVVGFMLFTSTNDSDKILQIVDMANTGKQFAKLHFNYITA